jgi:ElaB/YqjD/DUF883 family membrane-anchored ribosome-binding protein
MATEAQIHANRENARHSTGARTEEGKAASSRNALTIGLYTRADYVKPEERDLYKEFCETLFTQLSPEGLLEETFAAEITGASWRLRRCNAVEADLADYAEHDPMLDESTEKTRRTLERARSHAHSLLHRSINQLRRLQTERACRDVMDVTTDDAGIADFQPVVKAANNFAKTKQLQAKARENAFDRQLASICKPAPEFEPELENTPRNAPRSPGSGPVSEAA